MPVNATKSRNCIAFFSIFLCLNFTWLQILRGKYTEIVQVCKKGIQKNESFFDLQNHYLFSVINVSFMFHQKIASQQAANLQTGGF
jgi:hypothetical protein